MPTIQVPCMYRKSRISSYRFNYGSPNSYALEDHDASFGSSYNTRTRNTDKNWKVKIAKKQNASLPYFREENHLIPARVSSDDFRISGIDRIDATGRSCWSGNPLNFGGFDDLVLRDQAVARLNRKISSRVQGMQAMAPIAELRELRETYHLMTRMTQDLVDLLVALKRRNVRKAYRIASEHWLNWSFGVKPLMADLADAAEAIWTYLKNYDRVERLSAYAGRGWVSESLSFNEPHTLNSTLRCRWQYEHFLSYRITCGHRFQLDSANGWSLKDQFNISIPALVPAAWELVPFSFLVDYFTTTGAYLEDFYIGHGTNVYVTVTKRYKVIGKGNVSIDLFDSNTHKTYESISQPEFDFFSFDRSIWPTVPARLLRWKTLDEIGRNGVNRLLNTLALLGSSRPSRHTA